MPGSSSPTPIVAPTQTQATDNSNFGGQNATQMAATEAATKTMPVAPVTPSAAKTEPTVLTSGNITDTVIPQNASAAADLNNKGTYIGHDGNTYHSDGTLAWTGQLAPGEAPPGIDNPEKDPNIDEINRELGGMKVLSDASTKQSLDATHQMYASRVAMQNDINGRSVQTTDQKENNNGAARYAPADASSVITAQEKAGMMVVQNLESKESAAIAKVNAAQAKGDQTAMNSAIKEATSIRKQKQTEADKLQTTVQKNNDAIAKVHTQSLRDAEIATAVAKGTTDPSKLLTQLNSNPDGSDNQNGYTLKEINAALSDLSPKNTSTSDLYKFTNAETGKLLSSGLNATQIQGVADDLNGRGDGSTLKGLTPAQQGVLSSVMAPQKVTNTKPLVSGDLTYTNEDVGKISGWLNQTKGTDGYVDPTAYQRAFDAWTKSVSDGGSGGLAKDFLLKFPPKQYINPSNVWLPQYLSSRGAPKKSASSTSSADLSNQIDQLLGPSGS